VTVGVQIRGPLTRSTSVGTYHSIVLRGNGICFHHFGTIGVDLLEESLWTNGSYGSDLVWPPKLLAPFLQISKLVAVRGFYRT
jgi:hypothetical protein